jgi:hypothetical protein
MWLANNHCWATDVCSMEKCHRNYSPYPKQDRNNGIVLPLLISATLSFYECWHAIYNFFCATHTKCTLYISTILTLLRRLLLITRNCHIFFTQVHTMKPLRGFSVGPHLNYI